MPQLARRQPGVSRELAEADLLVGGVVVEQGAHAPDRKMAGLEGARGVHRSDHAEELVSERMGQRGILEVAAVRRTGEPERGAGRRQIPSHIVAVDPAHRSEGRRAMTVGLVRSQAMHDAAPRPMLAFDVHATRRPHDLPGVMGVARSGDQRADVQRVRRIGMEHTGQSARHRQHGGYQRTRRLPLHTPTPPR